MQELADPLDTAEALDIEVVERKLAGEGLLDRGNQHH